MSLVNKHKYIFNIQTVQSGAFRVLVEALKDILTDCNFIFDEDPFKLFNQIFKEQLNQFLLL